MGLLNLLHDSRFNIFFSFMVGVGMICIIRPQCSGSDCNVNKAPEDKDFDKYVYRMTNGKCYEFKTEMTDCPASGAIEAFKEGCTKDGFRDQFARRTTPIQKM
jgi:hypothetical protein